MAMLEKTLTSNIAVLASKELHLGNDFFVSAGNVCVLFDAGLQQYRRAVSDNAFGNHLV